jgi:hypothetical protein
VVTVHGELGRGVLERVVVGDLGEGVVGVVGVAAAAVGLSGADRDLVVAGKALDAVLPQQRVDGLGLGAVGPEVAEAHESVGPAGAGVVEERAQGVGIRVDPAAERQSRHGFRA